MEGRSLGEYLEDLVTHPDGRCLQLRESDRDMWKYRLGQYAEGSFQSIVADVPSLTEEEIALFFKVLKPGGHLCLMSDEGAAAISEDLGFELRDTIYLANSATDIFYCAKASRAEREAGLEHLPAKSRGMSGGAQNKIAEGEQSYQEGESLGYNRISQRKNTHPTVKPIKVLDWLLEEFGPNDLDSSPIILDPFMGSGTAGIASKKKSFFYVGMEINPEYFEIAKARIGEYADMELVCGDCVELMQELPDACVDLVLCDPPYGLKFMAKGWDNLGAGIQQEAWHINWLKEAYRVLKPEGKIVAFGGTRTFHRLLRAMEAVNLRDRRTLAWVYGSGFPKSHNIALGIDKKFGGSNRGAAIASGSKFHPTTGKARAPGKPLPKYESKTKESEGWDGWGSALKPAWEAICVGTKK